MACTLSPWKCWPGTGWSAVRCVLLVALALVLPLPWASGQFADHEGQRGRFQDLRALQRLSMGMYFYREGVLNPRTGRVSKTFLVPRPRLQDLLPQALVPLASSEDSADNTVYPTSDKMLLKTLTKNFKAMDIAIDEFPERPNSSLTSPRDVRLPPWRHDPFPQGYLDAESHPGYLAMEKDLFIPSKDVPKTKYESIDRKVALLGDFSKDVEMTSLALTGLRNHSQDVLTRMVEDLDRYVLRHHALVLDSHQVASLARDFTLAVNLLRDNVVSPDLIPMAERVRLQDEVASMVGGGPKDMEFTTSVDSVTRDEANVYITISVEGGSKEDLFDVYSVHTPTLYLDVEEGKGSTKLVDVPPYFAVSRDGDYFIEMTRDQFRDCVRDKSLHCPHTFLISPASSKQSCLWALFNLDKTTMRRACHYEARNSTPPTAAMEYDKGWLFLTNVRNVTFVHMNGSSAEIPACPQSQCVAFVPCHYRARADHFMFPARHSDCIERDPVLWVFFPINLAVVYHTERKLFVFFLIPPNAIETKNIPVPHADIENLRNRSAFTIVEDVVEEATLQNFHQGPLPNATSPHGKSVYESPADKAMVAVLCLALIPMIYLTWRTMRVVNVIKQKATCDNVFFDAREVMLEVARGALQGEERMDRLVPRPDSHIYTPLLDDRSSRRGEKSGAGASQSTEEEALQYQLEKEADEIYRMTRENMRKAQREERRRRERDAGTQDRNAETQGQYLHPIHQTYSQGPSRRPRRQRTDAQAQDSTSRGQDVQAQRRHDVTEDSQASIYMTIEQDQSELSHEYASCDAATLKIR